jgi:hypothetical protein
VSGLSSTNVQNIIDELFVSITNVQSSINNTVLNSWQIVTSSQAATVGDQLFVDVSSGNIAITLPITPSVGDTVVFADLGGNFSPTNSLVIARNNERIMGLEEDMVVDDQFAAFALTYSNSANGWKIIW